MELLAETLPAPKAILFDWDNTLVDTWPVIHEANAQLFRHMGMEPWTLEETRAKVRKSLRETFPDLFGDRWEEARDYFYAVFNEIHLDALRPIDGAEEMLGELVINQGLPLGIVSNKTHDALIEEVNHLGWDRFFEICAGAGSAPKDKPDPAHSDFALKALGMEAGHQIWYVGDTDVDMTLARRANLFGVLVPDGHSGDTWRSWDDKPALVCSGLAVFSGAVSRAVSGDSTILE